MLSLFLSFILSLQSTVYSLQSTVYSLQSTVYSLQSTVYRLQSTVYWFQSSVYTVYIKSMDSLCSMSKYCTVQPIKFCVLCTVDVQYNMKVYVQYNKKVFVQYAHCTVFVYDLICPLSSQCTLYSIQYMCRVRKKSLYNLFLVLNLVQPPIWAVHSEILK